MIKKVRHNIWEWGVKPMAVGSAVVGALAAAVAVVVYGVVKTMHVYQDQFGMTPENAQIYAIFTPIGIFFTWAIGCFVIDAYRQHKRTKQQWDSWDTSHLERYPTS